MVRGVVVVGSAHEKRGSTFVAAWQRQTNGPAPLRWASWADVAANPAVLANVGSPGDFLRVDSPGSDAEVWSALARRGGLEEPFDPSQQRPGRAWFGGLSETLRAIASHTTHLVPTHPAESVITMMDKRLCHRALAQAGLPVPPVLPAERIRDAEIFRAALRRDRHHAVFVKPRWGSSGAGVLAYRWQGDHERITTTARLAADGVHNDKHLHTYADRASIDRLLDRILGDGAVIERWLPKAGAAGGPFDLRVVTVGGQPAQRVARVGRGTVTNLHLDSARLAFDEALAPWGSKKEAEVLDVCRAAAACFPAHLTIGVDLLLDVRGRPFVLELNAWGDYLPGLLHDGEDTYDTQVRAMLASTARGTTAA